MNAYEIAMLSLSVGAIGLSVVLGFIQKFKSNKANKAKNICESELDLERKVPELCQKAETFANFNGEQKKDWVITKISNYCLTKKIPFDEVLIEKAIETFIDFTKSINSNGVSQPKKLKQTPLNNHEEI